MLIKMESKTKNLKKYVPFRNDPLVFSSFILSWLSSHKIKKDQNENRLQPYQKNEYQ